MCACVCACVLSSTHLLSTGIKCKCIASDNASNYDRFVHLHIRPALSLNTCLDANTHGLGLFALSLICFKTNDRWNELHRFNHSFKTSVLWHIKRIQTLFSIKLCAAYIVLLGEDEHQCMFGAQECLGRWFVSFGVSTINGIQGFLGEYCTGPRWSVLYFYPSVVLLLHVVG